MAFLDTTGLTHLVSLIKENFLGINDKAASAATADLANSALMSDAAGSAQVADRLGSQSVGSGTNPIYLDEGTAEASNSTVGDAYTPIYMDSGTLAACDFSQDFAYVDAVDADYYGTELGEGLYHVKFQVSESGSNFPDDISYPVFFTSDTNTYGALQVAYGAEGELYARRKSCTELSEGTMVPEDWDGHDWVKYATEAYVDNAISTVDVSSYIPNSGDAGSVSTYYTVSEDTTTVNDDSPFLISASDDITIENGTEGKAWVKIIYCGASSQSITVGSNWKWMGNRGMALYSYCVLVCYWLGSKGFIEYINTVAEGALVTKTSLAETLADYATTEYVDSAISELSAE